MRIIRKCQLILLSCILLVISTLAVTVQTEAGFNDTVEPVVTEIAEKNKNKRFLIDQNENSLNARLLTSSIHPVISNKLTHNPLIDGYAYAVKTDNNELVFFRSKNVYTNGSSGTFTDLSDNPYTGIVYTGFETATYNYVYEVPWYSVKRNIVSVSIPDNQIISPVSTKHWFADFDSVISMNLSGLDTSETVNMYYMFECQNLPYLDVSHFDTSKVVDMSYMFAGCNSLKELDVSHFDTGNVSSMEYMFMSCSSLTSLNVSHFNTENVTVFTGIFRGCSSLPSIDVTHFTTSQAVRLDDMFDGCSGLSTLNLSSFDTRNAISLSQLFAHCSGLSEIDVSNFDTSNVEDMSYMFYDCTGLTSLDITHFDTSNATSMRAMFSNCTGLTEIDLSNLDTSKVTDLESMFADCTSLTSLDVSRFNTGSTIDMSSMFLNCRGLTSIEGINNFDTSKVVNMRHMFSGCENIVNLILNNFDTGSVTVTNSMFYGCTNLKELDVSSFDTSSVYDMEYMFYGCSNLKKLDLYSFDTARVGFNYGTMRYIFSGCSSLTELNIGKFNLKNVQDPKKVSDFYYSCFALEKIRLGSNYLFEQPNQLPSGIWYHRMDDGTIISKTEYQLYLDWGTHAQEWAGYWYKYPISSLDILSDDPGDIYDCAEEGIDIDELLEDISFRVDDLRGPSITIAGKTFYIFEIDTFKLKFPIPKKKGWEVTFCADPEEKTIQVLIGPAISAAGKIENDSDRATFEKYYDSIQDLWKSTIGFDKTNQGLRNASLKTWKLANATGMDIGVKVKGEVLGFLEFSYETGDILFSEGGILINVSGNGSMFGRIPGHPLWYVAVGLQVNTAGQASVARTLENKYKIHYKNTINSEIRVGVGLGQGDKTKDVQAYVEGGLFGNLAITMDTMGGTEEHPDKPLYIETSAGAYLEWKVKAGSVLEIGDTYKKDALRYELYPELKNLNENADSLPGNITMSRFLNKAKPISRDYYSQPIGVRSVHDNYSFYLENIYPYAEPKLYHLGEGKMIMVWVADSGDKGLQDRTSVVYSIYEEGTWSEPAVLFESGTYNDHPISIQDEEGNIHVVWMRSDTPYDDDWNQTDLYEHLDLVYSKYDVITGTWMEPVLVSEASNGFAETDYSVDVASGIVTISWVTNSENNLLMEKGTNVVYARTYEEGVWSDIDTLYTDANALYNLFLHEGYQYYSLYNASSDDMTVYRIRLDDHSISSVLSGRDQYDYINGNKYYLNGGTLYRNGKNTQLEGLSNFSVIENRENRVVLTLVSTGLTCELYGSYYDPSIDAYGNWVQLTDYGKYIRDYSVVLDDDGRIVAALNLVDVDYNAERAYGDASLVVTEDTHFTDLAVTDYLGYSDLNPSNEAEIYVEVMNNSAEDIHTLTFTVEGFGETRVIAQNVDIPSGETAIVTIPYTMPDTITITDLIVGVRADYSEEEKNLTNNTATGHVGFAELEVSMSEPYKSEEVWYSDITVTNTGLLKSSEGTVLVHGGNLEDEIIDTILVKALEPGEFETFVYAIPRDLYHTRNEEVMNALHVEFDTETEELNLFNNEDRIVFANLEPYSYTVTWEWIESEENGYDAVAHFACNESEEMSKDVAAVVSVDEDTHPTCTEEGKTVYKAVVPKEESPDGSEYIDTKEIILEAEGHDYVIREEWIGNDEDGYTGITIIFTCEKEEEYEEVFQRELAHSDVPATCTENGERVYSAVLTAEESPDEQEHVFTKAIILKAFDHEWNDPAYTWSEDNTSITATRVCLNDETHVETETVETVYTVTTEPVCEEPGVGTYAAAFTNEAFAPQSKEVPIAALGHSYGEWTRVKDPTCTETGLERRVCAHDPSHKEERILPALGHDYGDPTYEWSEDNKTVTVERACKRDSSHKETETVNTTYKVTKDPTCEEKGTGVYTAVFANTAFETQTKEESINALGHSWSDWEVITPPTEEKEGLERRVCQNDPSHTEERAIPKLDPVVNNTVIRLSGSGRYETAMKTADELKTVLNVDKFDTVILATGSNFADALGGGYLAAKKSAPILLTSEKKSADVNAYINANLKENGTVYVLGGTGAVSEKCLEGIDTPNIRRLSGRNRYLTSLAILEEAGVTNEDILIVTGYGESGYADSLSASATGKPMLLVNGKNTSLTKEQKDFLTAHSSNTFYIIGGTGAVSQSIQDEVDTIHTSARIAGRDRFLTSTLIAETFFSDPDQAVLAFSHNYPDGLAGGPLAYFLRSPILLTREKNKDVASSYTVSHSIKSGYICGGEGALPDSTVRTIFQMEETDVIVKR